jgi:hypothetical protein
MSDSHQPPILLKVFNLYIHSTHSKHALFPGTYPTGCHSSKTVLVKKGITLSNNKKIKKIKNEPSLGNLSLETEGLETWSSVEPLNDCKFSHVSISKEIINSSSCF